MNQRFGYRGINAIAHESAQVFANAAKAWGQNDDITVVTVRMVG
jgi:hypothetical protein